MNIDRARTALDAPAKIKEARRDWRHAVSAITNYGTGFMGPQGVSSNSQFDDAAMKLFDGHVAHLIERHKATIAMALHE